MATPKIMLTGDRPTGRLHIGHYVGSLRRRVELQNQGDFDKMFVFIADAQALTDNTDNPEKVRQNVVEVALDYLACGLDPEKVTFFIQSQIPELCELAFYFQNLVTVSRLQRNPTVKTEIGMRGFEGSIPRGILHLPHLSSCRHRCFPCQRGASGGRPTPHDRTSYGNRAPLQSHLWRHSRRAQYHAP